MHRAVQEPRRHRDEEAAAPALPTDKVRFVGDPIAFVVAETLLQAKDAAEAVEVDIDPLPAVTDPEDGRAARARRSSTTTCRTTSRSTITTATPTQVAAAFAKAAHVTRSSSSTAAWWSTRWSRARRSATSTRAAASRCIRRSQGVFGMRGNIAALLSVEPKQVRVLTGNVGGSFGMKAAAYPGIRLRAACRARARPAGEVDRRALRQLRLRQPRPRPSTSPPSSRSTPTALSWRCGSRASATWAASSPMSGRCPRRSTPSRTCRASTARR